MKYSYTISGYYFADNERIHFEESLEAEDNYQAMQLVIGELAWHTSIEHKTFKLDVIHYECD